MRNVDATFFLFTVRKKRVWYIFIITMCIMPVEYLWLVMSYNVTCSRSITGHAYCHVLLQFLKLQPVLVLHYVHSREASHTQLQCKEMESSVALFFMMGYSQWDNRNGAVSVDECLCLLSFFISITSSCTTVNSAVSNTGPQMIATPVQGRHNKWWKYYSLFSLNSDMHYEIKLIRFLSCLQQLSVQTFNFIFFIDCRCSLKELILSAHLRIFAKSAQDLGDVRQQRNSI